MNQLQTKAFGSEMFPTSRWSIVYERPAPSEIGDNAEANAMAEVAWFELGHLKVGQAVDLSGEHFAGTFYRTKWALACVLPDGRSGEYVHTDDYKWLERRREAEAFVTAIEEGRA